MPTKKDLLHYKGPYGTNLEVALDFVRHETLASRGKTFDWEIQEHLHADLHQLFWIESGKGEIKTAMGSIDLHPPCLICIPCNTLHGFTFDPATQGDVLTFSPIFLEKTTEFYPEIGGQLLVFQRLGFSEGDVAWHEIRHVKNRLVLELEENAQGKELAVQTLFQWLFLLVFRRANQGRGDELSTDHRAIRYFQDFQKSIKRSFQDAKTIVTYARELKITPVHLNRVCHQVVGMSALQVVHDFLIQQAKTYLRGTDYSISEITYFLNLKDPAYFTRFFKRQTGMTPSDFRRTTKKIPE